MLDDHQFQQYLDLCEQIAERMYREGSWPWKNDGQEDSTNEETLLDSKHNS